MCTEVLLQHFRFQYKKCLWHKDNTGAQRTSQSAKTAVEWHKEGGIYFTRALKESQPRHYAKALKYFKEAQKLDQDSPTLWFHIAVTLFCMGNYSEARAAGIEAASLARHSGDEETCTEAKKVVGHSEIELMKARTEKQKAK